jgi:hypothetical protein
MTELLNQGWVGSVIGIIGVLLAVLGLIAYRTSRIGPRPAFQLHSRQLIGRKEQELPNEVEVLFNREPVHRLTISRIVFWNSGNATVQGESIVQTDPLRLEIEDGVILKAHIPKVTREVINFAVRPYTSSTQAALTFDFLDPGDGAVLEVLHTSEKRDPTVAGTIRGIPRGVASWGEFSGPMQSVFPSKTSPYLRQINRIMFAVVAVFGVLAIISALLPEHIVKTVSGIIRNMTKSSDTGFSFSIGKRILLLVMGIVYALPPAMLFWLRRRRFPKSLQVNRD